MVSRVVFLLVLAVAAVLEAAPVRPDQTDAVQEISSESKARVERSPCQGDCPQDVEAAPSNFHESNGNDLETAAGTNVLRPLFVYRQQVAYRQRVREAQRRRNARNRF